jgi:hypothetical protein
MCQSRRIGRPRALRGRYKTHIVACQLDQLTTPVEKFKGSQVQRVQCPHRYWEWLQSLLKATYVNPFDRWETTNCPCAEPRKEPVEFPRIGD